MSMKAVVISCIVAALAATTSIAQSTAPEQVRGKASAVKPAAPARAPASTKPLPAAKKAEAEADYRETLDIVGHASEIGDEGQAFLLYTDVILKLRKIRGQYPDFKAKEIDAKIKEVSSLLVNLEDAKCQSLEDEKAGRFRFLVWKRQILILDRIDKLQKASENNNEMLEEIKDKLGI